MAAEDGAALRALLGAYRDRIGHIFFGHTHLTVSGTLAGVPFAGVRSAVHQASFTYDGPVVRHGTAWKDWHKPTPPAWP